MSTSREVGESVVRTPLLTAARRGDEGAFERLHDELYGAMRSEAARRLSLSGGEWEEHLQSARIGLWRAVRSWRPGGVSFEVFARFCIRRQIVSDVRAYWRRGEHPVTFAERWEAKGGPVVADKRLGPLAHVLVMDQIADLSERMTASLTPLEMYVLVHEAVGYRPAQLALAMGRSRRSVDTALRRAERKLGVTRSPEMSQADDVISRYSSGATCAEIGAAVGMSDTAVRGVLAQHGVSRRRRGTRALHSKEQQR